MIYSGNDTLISILEDYLDEKRLNSFSDVKFKERLKRLNKSDEQAHAILLEMENEWNLEELESIGLTRGKTLLIMGSISAIVFAILTVLSAVGLFSIGNYQIYFFVLIAFAVLLASRGYHEVKKWKHRKKRREIKWEYLEKTFS